MKVMRIILCCGKEGRAVVVGDVVEEPVPGQPVRLTDCRMVLYWDKECGGLFGLATKGPRGKTHITHAVPIVVETVWQEWFAVSDVAADEVDQWTAA